MEKDYPDQLYHPYRKERRETKEGYMRKKKSITKVILKKENSDREHTICRLKKFRILVDVFRNKLRKYDKVSDIV